MKRRCLLASVFSLALVSPASGQDPRSTIAVTSGSASAELRPTAAQVALGIDNRAKSASLAASENAARQQRLLAALLRLGFTSEQARITSYSVRSDVDYETGELRAYEASAVVSVAVDQLDRLGKLVDSALASGATEVATITYTSDSLASARDRVLREALAAARKDAESLARSAGGRLGRLLEVSTRPFAQSAGYSFAVEDITIGRSGLQAIAPRDVTVALTVYARWEIEY